MKKLVVMIAALALVATSALTAAAADWNFYGSARVSTFYQGLEANVGNAPDVDNYKQALQGNSRIGANVKVSDELTGRFEYGTGVNTRILWGEWNFGAGSLGVGRHYTPLDMFYSNQVFGDDTGLLNTGGVYSGRLDMLQLTFGGFKIAAIAPNNVIGLGGFGTETTFPLIEAKYSMKYDNFSFNLAGGYQTYDVINTPSGDQSVDSWVAAFGAKAHFGAFALGGNVYTGQNAGHIIAIRTDGSGAFAGDGRASWDGVNVQDNDAWGYLLVAEFKINDMLGLEAGYGYAEVETLGGAGSDDEVQAYYLNMPITLAPGVAVIPEIGRIDGKDNWPGQSELTYFGAKWQINF